MSRKPTWNNKCLDDNSAILNAYSDLLFDYKQQHNAYYEGKNIRVHAYKTSDSRGQVIRVDIFNVRKERKG